MESERDLESANGGYSPRIITSSSVYQDFSLSFPHLHGKIEMIIFSLTIVTRIKFNNVCEGAL